MPVIDRGDDYFQAGTYTGNGSTQTISGLRFQPDFVWIKGRSGATDHALYDAVRGATKQLESNQTGAESTESTGLTAFTSDGFTLGSLAQVNTNAATYAYWAWKANGAGSSNTAGTTSATVSVNTTSGFSIITATTPSTYTSHTVGHGLGVTPAFIIYKERNQTSNWQCWHRSLSGATNLIQLNTTTGEQSGSFWGTHTSTVIACGGGIQSATSSPLVMYAFAPVAGYSAFGSYTGNGSSTDGPFIYTGFRPRYVLIKSSSNISNWIIFDSARGTYNVNGPYLYANGSDAEGTSTTVGLDFLSNGFKHRNNYGDANTSSRTYIYMALAENPFKYSLAR